MKKGRVFTAILVAVGLMLTATTIAAEPQNHDWGALRRGFLPSNPSNVIGQKFCFSADDATACGQILSFELIDRMNGSTQIRLHTTISKLNGKSIEYFAPFEIEGSQINWVAIASDESRTAGRLELTN